MHPQDIRHTVLYKNAQHEIWFSQTWFNQSHTQAYIEYSAPLRVSLTWIIVASVTQKTTYPQALELAYSLFNWGAAG